MAANILNFKQSFALMKLLEDEYSISGKNDSEFAKYASEKLSLPLTVAHIYNRRTELGIPAYRPLVTKKDTTAAVQLMADMEAKITALTSRVAVLEKLITPLYQAR